MAIDLQTLPVRAIASQVHVCGDYTPASWIAYSLDRALFCTHTHTPTTHLHALRLLLRYEIESVHVSFRFVSLVYLQSGLKEVLRDTEKEHDDGDSSGPGLEVRIYYLECLAQASYVVSHEGNAFIVDPRRDVDAFLEVCGWIYLSVLFRWVW